MNFRVLDLFSGIGGFSLGLEWTGGFDFVGCEIDEDYFKAAKERFDKETAQMAMEL